MSKSMVFYTDWFDAAEQLESPQEQLDFIKGILNYGLREIVADSDCTLPARLGYNICKGSVDTNQKKRDGGALGGAPKGNANAKKVENNQPMVETKQPMVESKQPTINVNDNVNDNVKVNDNVRVKEVAKASATSSKKSSLINEWLLTLSPIWAELMRFWLKYKQERGESYKGLQGPKAALKNLQEFSNNDPAKAKAVIDQSIANNWAGLFNLKNDKNNGTDKKPFGQSYADRIIVPNREIFKTEQGTI